MTTKKVFQSALLLVALGAFGAGCTVRAGGRAHAHGGAAQSAVASSWESLGSRWVDGRADRDAVFAARQGRFRQLMFQVSGSDLVMRDVVITFGNGSTYSPPTQLVFDRGTRSRVIDLPGDDRTIARVDFRYGNLPGGGRAHVDVFGR